MSDLQVIGVSVSHVGDELLAYSGALRSTADRIRQLAGRAVEVARGEGQDAHRAAQVARTLELAAAQCAAAAASMMAASRSAHLFVSRNVSTGMGGGGTVGSAPAMSSSPDLSTPNQVALADYSGDGYRAMDQALWGRTPLSPRLAERIVAVSHALQILPDYEGLVVRGTTLSEADLAKYVPGQVVTHHGFTSSDRVRPFAGNTQFIILSRHGKWIRAWSQNARLEDEVLFDRSTSFLVVDHQVLDNGTHRIYLEEVR